MTKLKLPPANEQKTYRISINGVEAKFSAPENHTGSSNTIESFQRGMRNGAFKGLSLE